MPAGDVRGGQKRGGRFPRGRSPICRHRTQAEREPGNAGAGGRTAPRRPGEGAFGGRVPAGLWGGPGAVRCRPQPWGSCRSPRRWLYKYVCRCLSWGSVAGFCERGSGEGAWKDWLSRAFLQDPDIWAAVRQSSPPHPRAHGLLVPLGTATLQGSVFLAVCDWSIKYCPGEAALYALLLKGERLFYYLFLPGCRPLK